MKKNWIVGFFIFLTACNFTREKVLPEPIPAKENYNQTELTFSNVYAKVFRTNCLSCHGDSGEVNLETYENVKTNLKLIFKATIVNRKMPKPPVRLLTPDQLGLLNAWIQAGAPEGATEPVQPTLPLQATFASIRTNIFETKCFMCHAVGQSAERVPLDSREALLTSPLELVIPGQSAESGLVLAIMNDRPDKVMPPILNTNGEETGFSRLSTAEIQIIRDWIDRGAND
jgi:uncharacterized membrane protein